MLPIIFGGVALIGAATWLVSRLEFSGGEPVVLQPVKYLVGTGFAEPEVKAEKRAADLARLANEQLHRELWQRRQEAEAHAATVELYPASFAGRVERPRLGKWMETEPCESQESARHELQVIAALHRCAVVQSMELRRHPTICESNPNYVRSRWSARGLM